MLQVQTRKMRVTFVCSAGDGAEEDLNKHIEDLAIIYVLRFLILFSIHVDYYIHEGRTGHPYDCSVSR